MSRSNSSSGSRAPTPAFLKPTRDSLSQILTTLYEREQLRRTLGQQSRLLAAAASSSHSQASNGWYSVAVGTLPGNVNKNRCALVTSFSDEVLLLIFQLRRYGDIIAYDRTRVLPDDVSSADVSPADSESPPYVNASLVREPELGIDGTVLPRRWWIAAQVMNLPRAFAQVALKIEGLTPFRCVLSRSRSPGPDRIDRVRLSLAPPDSPILAFMSDSPPAHQPRRPAHSARRRPESQMPPLLP